MIVYKDKISGDDMFTDAYKVQDDGVFYKVTGKMVTEKDELDEKAFGANPSAEEAGESCETDAVSGCNIVIANRLFETSFDKKSYKVYISGYMKKLKDLIEDAAEQQEFMSKATAAVKDILSNFKEYRFFQGESMDPDGMIALMDFGEDGITPIMFFFKAGLFEEKQ